MTSNVVLLCHPSQQSNHMYLDLSPLFSPVCKYSCVLGTRLVNYTACNVEPRPLNCWNSVSTAQMVELTSDTFEIILPETIAAHPASRQPGHGASTPQASSDTVGVGEKDGVSDRGVIDPHRTLARQKLKNTSKKSRGRSPSSSCKLFQC